MIPLLSGRQAQLVKESPRRPVETVEGMAGKLFKHDTTERIAPNRGLPSYGVRCNVEFPKYLLKVSDTFLDLPRAEGKFVCKSFAESHPGGGTVSVFGDVSHIGGTASSVNREATATLNRGRGKDVVPPFSFKSQNPVEAHHD